MYRIIDFAASFRSAIEEAIKNGDFDDDSDFSRFPNGCCGFTSELLAKYLHFNGVETLYMSGIHRCNRQSHAWLETETGLVIDITRDQFSNRSGDLRSDIPVYVGNKDRFVESFELDDPVQGYDGTIDKPYGLCKELNKRQRDFVRRYEIIISHIH